MQHISFPHNPAIFEEFKVIPCSLAILIVTKSNSLRCLLQQISCPQLPMPPKTWRPRAADLTQFNPDFKSSRQIFKEFAKIDPAVGVVIYDYFWRSSVYSQSRSFISKPCRSTISLHWASAFSPAHNFFHMCSNLVWLRA